MCEYCEADKDGNFKPLATNDRNGFKTTLVTIAVDENTGRKVLQINYDESEPLRLALNACFVCGQPLAPKTGVPHFVNCDDTPKVELGSYVVRLDGRDEDNQERLLAIPNPANNYVMFCDVIRKIATGAYSDTCIPWGINRLAYLLDKRLIPILTGDGFVTLRYRHGNQPIIANNKYVYIPVVSCRDKTVTFSKETAWDKFTDSEFQYMKYIMDGIENGHVKLI